MQSDGFNPETFSGSINSHACEGVLYLENFMKMTWPSGKADIVGIASEGDLIRPPNMSAHELFGHLSTCAQH